VRQALGCLSTAADSAYDADSRPNKKVLKPAFQFLADSRQAVRHQAELTVALILRRAGSCGDQMTMDFASQHLVQMLSDTTHDKRSSDEMPAQRGATLLKALGPSLPEANLCDVFAALLKLPGKLGQHPCCIEGFGFMASYLRKEGEHGALAANLLPGLLGVPMAFLNVAYVVAYADALAACVAALTPAGVRAGLSPQLQKQKIAAVKRILSIFAERDPSLLRGAHEAGAAVMEAVGAHADEPMLQALPELCLGLLGYEAKGAFNRCFPVIGALFGAFGACRDRLSPGEVPAFSAAAFQQAKPLIEGLVAIRDKSHGGDINMFGEKLHECLGAAVSAFGPEHVLSVADLHLLEVPLSDQAFTEKSRSWMLLVLRDCCRRANLALFSQKFLPLASALKSRVSAAAAISPIEGKRYETMLEHVWGVLPGFCSEPLDMPAAMLGEGGKLAKQLVSVLQGEPALRDHVWAAFTRLTDGVNDPQSDLARALCDSNRQCLQTLSGRVLPEMFNAYLKVHAESEGQDATRLGHSRYVALGAVKSYALACDPKFVSDLFKKLVARLLKATAGEADGDASQAKPLADLANVLVPLLTGEGLELALKVFLPMLSSGMAGLDDKKGTGGEVQKMAYKAICSVISHPLASTGGLGEPDKVLLLWASLRDARQTCSGAALKARLQTMEALLTLMDQRLPPKLKDPAVRQEFMSCLRTLLPEVLLHLRDQSTAVRDAARECLSIAVTTSITSELQEEVVTLLSAGLAGLTRSSRAQAVEALSRLLYEHSAKISNQLQDRLIPVVLLLLADSDPQVWRATLKFAKVASYITSRSQLERILPQILKLFESPHLRSAQMRIRSLIERLVKVLPPEVLAEAFPKKHVALLHYMQRQVARWGRPKTVRLKKEDEDAEGEGDEEKDAKMEGDDEDARGPKESWEKFDEGDEDEGGKAKEPVAGAKKRVRGSEPPTSSLMAHDAVQALLDAWEAESDGDDDGKSGKKSKRKREEVAASTWIHEDKDVPLDFMSADAAHSVLTVRPPQRKRRRGAEQGLAGAQNRADALRLNGLKFSEDGRLVVNEVEEEAASRKKDDEDGEGNGLFSHGTGGKKPKALSQLAEKRQARLVSKAKARAGRRGTHLVKGLDDFKPKKKSAGDAQRKGSSLKPFAYVRLNPKVTSEKHKTKATSTFDKVLKGAKAGVLRGKKAKVKDLKMRQAKKDRKNKQARGKTHKPGSR